MLSSFDTYLLKLTRKFKFNEIAPFVAKFMMSCLKRHLKIQDGTRNRNPAIKDRHPTHKDILPYLEQFYFAEVLSQDETACG